MSKLLPEQVAGIIQKAWDEKAPDVMCFGLAVACRIEAAIAAVMPSHEEQPTHDGAGAGSSDETS